MKRFYIASATALCLSLALAVEEPSPLLLRSTIALPGVEGRFDHAAMDAREGRLFFAALGNDTLEVVDLNSGSRLHTIREQKKPSGVLFLEELGLIVVANGGDGTCRFIDAKSFKELGRISGLEDADNLRFDEKAKKIYLGYGDGFLGIIEPKTRTLVASIALPAHPESFQLEENGPRIFINIPGAKKIAVVDRDSKKVIAEWPLDGALANFPMALAGKENILFVGCRQPASLLTFDIRTGERLAAIATDGDMDDLFYDAKSQRLIASCGSGFVDVFQFSAPNKLVRTNQLASPVGARTSFLNPSTSTFCLAVPHNGSQGAEIKVFTLAPVP